MTSNTLIALDPAFAYQPAGRLMPAPACEWQDAWRYLSSAVARDALDVEAHTRRVLLAIGGAQRTHAVTALLDLFLALGDKAKTLRAKLLEQALPCLEPEEETFFRHALDEGLEATAGLPMGTFSVLDSGLMGRTSMIQHMRAAARQESLAQQAAALVDQGDLAAARQLLEDGLLENPADSEAASELLAIYRHSRDAEAEKAMRQRLQQRHTKLSAPWV